MYLYIMYTYNVSVYHGELVHATMKAEKSQDLQSELETRKATAWFLPECEGLRSRNADGASHSPCLSPKAGED